MARNYHETLEEAAVALPPERSTGLVLSAALVGVAILWRSEPVVAAVGLALAAGLAGLSFAAPALLRPVNIAWMGLARLLAKIVNPIVMFILFCVTIVPFGLLMQLKHDPLRRRRTEADETFWIVPDTSFGPPDLTRQF